MQEPATASAAAGKSRGRRKRQPSAIAETGEAQAGEAGADQAPAARVPASRRRKAVVGDPEASADEATATATAPSTTAASTTAAAAAAATKPSRRRRVASPANTPAPASAVDSPASASALDSAASTAAVPQPPTPPGPPGLPPGLPGPQPLGLYAPLGSLGSAPPHQQPPAEEVAAGGRREGVQTAGSSVGIEEERAAAAAAAEEEGAVLHDGHTAADGAREWISDRRRARAPSYLAVRALQMQQSAATPRRAELAGAELAMEEVWKALELSPVGRQRQLICGPSERQLLESLDPGLVAARARVLAGLLVEREALGNLFTRRPAWLLAQEPEQAFSRLVQLADAVGVAVADVLDVAAEAPRLLDEEPDVVRQRTAEMAAALAGGLEEPPRNPRALVAAMIRQRPSLAVSGAGDWGWRLRILREWGFVSQAAALLRARRYDPPLACRLLAELLDDDGTTALGLALPFKGDPALRDRLRPLFAAHGDVGVVTESPELLELGFRPYADPLAPEGPGDRLATFTWVNANRERLMRLAQGDEDRTGQGPDRSGLGPDRTGQQGSGGGGLAFSVEEVLGVMSAVAAKQERRGAKAAALAASVSAPAAADSGGAKGKAAGKGLPAGGGRSRAKGKAA